MKQWLNTLDVSDSVYGDKPYGDYWIEVPIRPDFIYDWDGSKWILNPAKVPVQKATIDDVVANLDAATQAKIAATVAAKQGK